MHQKKATNKFCLSNQYSYICEYYNNKYQYLKETEL